VVVVPPLPHPSLHLHVLCPIPASASGLGHCHCSASFLTPLCLKLTLLLSLLPADGWFLLWLHKHNYTRHQFGETGAGAGCVTNNNTTKLGAPRTNQQLHLTKAHKARSRVLRASQSTQRPYGSSSCSGPSGLTVNAGAASDLIVQYSYSYI
jgi:hypothetical protein